MSIRFSFPALAAAGLTLTPALHAQARGAAAPPAPATPKAAAPIDLTGYWVSQIVDEWRFRVKPEKGDIAYMPLNPAARRTATCAIGATFSSRAAQTKDSAPAAC